MDLDGT